MSNITSSKNLPFVLQTIETNRFDGELICNSSIKLSASLFFRAGKLIHVLSSKPAQPCQQVLHELLDGLYTSLEWQTLQVRMAAPNVTDDIRHSFNDVLQILVASGNFNALTESELDPDFFQISNILTTVNKPILSNIQKPAYSVERNLLLPLGKPQNALEEELNALNFRQQLSILEKAKLTGYAYYHFSGDSGSYGLVLFANGEITNLVYVNDERLFGQAAYQALLNFNIKPEVYTVDSAILKAYRAWVDPEKPARKLALTKPNFLGAVEAFKAARRDGMLVLNVNKLRLHYFFLFESGRQIGVFGPEAKTGRLQALSAPLSIPSGDANATIDVLLARPFSNWSSANIVEEIFKPVEFPSLGLAPLVLPVAPEVQWGKAFAQNEIEIDTIPNTKLSYNNLNSFTI